MSESPNSAGPLAGLRVVEFAGLGPAPLCGMLLADLGADVIVVGRPAGRGPTASVGITNQLTDRGKRLATLDLKHGVDRESALALLTQADALIEGFRPGTLERLGLGPEVVLACNPRLVYTRLTGWGQTGPRAHTAGHDLTYIAITGALHAIGRAGQTPVPPLNLVGDFAGGTMFALSGMLAALLEAQRSGKGQVVDVAMTDGVAALLAPTLTLMAAGFWRDERGVNLLDGGAPFYDAYPAADGKFVAIGALENEFFAVLVRLLGLDPDLEKTRWDPATWSALRIQIAAAVATKSRDEWVALAGDSDACIAPVLDFHEAVEDPHNRARQTFLTDGGVVQPNVAPRFSRTPTESPVGRSGQRTSATQLLKDWSRAR